ncbi:metallophosphoesterase [Myxococcota bacterium]|nr:metallophosphoesterase [Myxococcota bacterium]
MRSLAWLFALAPLACTSPSPAVDASADPCPSCVANRDCPRGTVCAQVAGDTFCTETCAASCTGGRTCTTVTTAEGKQADVCAPLADVCGKAPELPDSGEPDPVASTDQCGPLVGPSITACCTSCTANVGTCQANGCYGGWFCNVETCQCRWAPSTTTCEAAARDAGPTRDATVIGDAGPPLDGSVGPSGGTLDVLSFAIVGDTRPALEDDTLGYPVSVIRRIWAGVEALDPRPAFAVTTGDYVFASPFTREGEAQLDLYLAAQAQFSGPVFHTLGNHECTGATSSNCTPASPPESLTTFEAFMDKMIRPLGKALPYHSLRVDAVDGSWSAKFVFVAANAWTDAQAAWLERELAVPTTYTFVVRHEAQAITAAPGVRPSEEIITRFPLTLRISGHAHTVSWSAERRELIVGNGGAPLSSSANYGFVLARQRADGAITFSSIDYASGMVLRSFAVQPDGTFVP